MTNVFANIKEVLDTVLNTFKAFFQEISEFLDSLKKSDADA